ncbi:MAG: LysM peptidoglycan-binding domain-containing protein [Desulfatibacillum sp.]|nr:LysM peptidoglycan-binding domain-containing protein [Desulfatibacillum sp.]
MKEKSLIGLLKERPRTLRKSSIWRPGNKNKRIIAKGVGLCVLALAMVCVVFPGAGWSTVLYKDYEIHQAFGEDILCDAYVVQKGDHIIELLRLRGQISVDDFPEFLSIFKAINPRVKDVNRIFPGQFLLIPLKKMPPGTLPEQGTGSVTLPLVTSQEPEYLPPVQDEVLVEHYEKYTVARGDTLSGIISPRFGGIGTPSYMEAMARFKELNPNIENVHRIYAGQQITLPISETGGAREPDMTTSAEPLSEKGFNSPVPGPEENTLEEVALSPPPMPVQPPLVNVRPENALNPLEDAISAMGGMVMNKGIYYFPRVGKEDLKLDLSKHPVLRMPDGRFMLLGEQTSLTKEEKLAVNKMWGSVEAFELPPQASPDMLLGKIMAKAGLRPDKVDLSFADGNVEVSVHSHLVLPGQGQYQYVAITWIEDPKETCHPDLVRYFADNAIRISDIFPGDLPEPVREEQADNPSTPKANRVLLDHPTPRLMVSALMRALGADYSENMPFSFPYAGFQVETVVNRLRTPDGKEMLLDFGTMGGQAHDTLKTMGFELVRISTMEDALNGSRNLARKLGLDYQWDPEFLAAPRTRDSCPSLRIPGLLLPEGLYQPVLVTEEPLHDMIISFLLDKGISVILVKQ